MGKKSTYKKLRQAAKELPTATRVVRVKMLGRLILEKDPNAKNKDGEPIDAKSYYMAPAPQKVNHYGAMKKAFKSGGLPNAVGYFKGVAEAAKKAGEEKEKAK
jgi:hypothetical protein